MMGFSRRGSTEAAGTSLEVALDIQASADQPPGIMEKPLSAERAGACSGSPCALLLSKCSAPTTLSGLKGPVGNDMPLSMANGVDCHL